MIAKIYGHQQMVFPGSQMLRVIDVLLLAGGKMVHCF